MSYSRRRFLATAGAGLTSMAFPGTLRGADRDRLRRIGLQLYTVREAMADDFEATLMRVAAIGYDEVEFAGYFDRTPAQVRAVLQRAGLRAPAAHVPLESLEDDWEQVLDTAHTMGHQYLVVAWLPEERRKTIDHYQRTAELFNRAGEQAIRAGVRFAYHNHDFEFQPIGGQLPYDVLLAESDPNAVWFEMDLYWITKGGRDPLEYFDAYERRFPLVHVKDMAAGSAQTMVDVGKGAIDFRRIFARREQAGIQHYFVEHDQPADPFASIQASYAYLKGLEL